MSATAARQVVAVVAPAAGVVAPVGEVVVVALAVVAREAAVLEAVEQAAAAEQEEQEGLRLPRPAPVQLQGQVHHQTARSATPAMEAGPRLPRDPWAPAVERQQAEAAQAAAPVLRERSACRRPRVPIPCAAYISDGRCSEAPRIA